MRRVALLIAVVSLFALTLPLGAGADPPQGFVMTGADGAYVVFEQDGCQVNVDYVYADMVRYFFDRQIVRPHSDVEVRLAGTCGDLATPMKGVTPAMGDPDAVFVTLESAVLDGFEVTVEDADGATHTAVVELRWEGVGDTWTETTHTATTHFAGRFRFAAVTGTVTVGDLVVDETDISESPFIVHYNETQRH